MGAADTAKEFARIATTDGLSKDVIDLLEKKAALLAEQVAAIEKENMTLLRENRNLKSEKENLQKQLQNARPKGYKLNETAEKILKLFFNVAREISDREIASHFGLSLSVVDYHTVELWQKKLITSGRIGVGSRVEPGYEITALGATSIAQVLILCAFAREGAINQSVRCRAASVCRPVVLKSNYE
jgi:FtsZ-binding cell division protein ZapB